MPKVVVVKQEPFGSLKEELWIKRALTFVFITYV